MSLNVFVVKRGHFFVCYYYDSNKWVYGENKLVM